MSDRDALSRDAEAAWQAFAGAIAPDEGAQARVLQRVRARASAPHRASPVDDLDADKAATGSQNARRAAAAVLVVKSSAISVGLAGGALLSIKLIAAAVVPTPAPPAPSVEIPAPPPVEHRAEAARAQRSTPTASAAPTTPVAPPSALAGPPPSRSPAAEHDSASPSATPSAEDRLRAEIDLVGQMRDALQAGEHGRALELVATHRRDFRDGAFIEEREAFHAIAACRKGDANGPALAQRFATARPRSSQLAAVRAACNSAANDPMDPGARQQ